jgi:hypothetical protein
MKALMLSQDHPCNSFKKSLISNLGLMDTWTMARTSLLIFRDAFVSIFCGQGRVANDAIQSISY